MKDKMVAYWHQGGLEVFRLADQKPVKIASGRLESLASMRGGFGKKVLIVGRDLLLHVRKRYPPAPEAKLLKAVALEIGELFPLSRPAFHCRLFQSAGAYAVVDVWAWESERYSQIRQIFPFNYVVPEDLAFPAATPELKIFRQGGITSMLAHADGRFLAGASSPGTDFTQEDVERFLHGLEPYGQEIRKVKIYGPLSAGLKNIPEISRVGQTDYPPCLGEINALDLAKFKTDQDSRLWEKKGLVFRVVIYLLLGYALMQYLTLRNYDQATDAIRQKTVLLDKKAMSLDTGRQTEDYSAVVQEIREKMQVPHVPLQVMNLLAGKLPEGTFINRLTLNDNQVEISISSTDPLATLKALWDAKEVKKVSLKGPIAKDAASKMEKFNVLIELSR